MTSTLTTTTPRPILGKIVRHSGIAGQLAYSVSVSYPGETGATVVTFTGSTFGQPGPVVMLTDAFPRGIIVSDSGQYGATLSPEWVRRFFGA